MLVFHLFSFVLCIQFGSLDGREAYLLLVLRITKATGSRSYAHIFSDLKWRETTINHRVSILQVSTCRRRSFGRGQQRLCICQSTCRRRCTRGQRRNIGIRQSSRGRHATPARAKEGTLVDEVVMLTFYGARANGMWQGILHTRYTLDNHPGPS